jgi:hypothetical protein
MHFLERLSTYILEFAIWTEQEDIRDRTEWGTSADDANLLSRTLAAGNSFTDIFFM